MAALREDKLAKVRELAAEKNTYLAEHAKSKVEAALKAVTRRIKRLKIAGWVQVAAQERVLTISLDEAARTEEAKLDGCYVLKSNVPSAQTKAATLHDRYKDLKEVEWAFRTMKTTLLELRGIFVRTAEHTRAHVFIIMLAYQLAYELRRRWQDVELTLEEGIAELNSIQTMYVQIGDVECQTIPEPRPLGKQLLKELQLTLPDAIPHRHIVVEPRKKIKGTRRSKKKNDTPQPAEVS